MVMGSRRQSKSSLDADKALADAQKKLSEVKERGPEVSTLANSLREFREVNHIAEQWEEIITRRRGTSK